MKLSEAIEYINSQGGRANLVVELSGEQQIKECWTAHGTIFTGTTKGIVAFSEDAVFLTQ